MDGKLDKESFQRLVAKAKLAEALRRLILVARLQKDNDLLHDAILLSSELYRVDDAVIKGRVNWTTEHDEKKKISHRALKLIGRISFTQQSMDPDPF